MPDDFLNNPTALIIGAGRPPGPSLVRVFARRGVNVAANDLSPALLDPVLESVQGLPGKVKPYISESSRGMPLRAMLVEVEEDWGKIDMLINNPRVQPQVDLLDMDEWDWQRTVEMNLNGPFLVSKLVARSMREQGYGMIMNIIDADLETSEKGLAAYSASQSGLFVLSQAAEREFLTYNIQVYTLCMDRDMFNPAPQLEPPLRTSNEAGPEHVLAQLVEALCGSQPTSLAPRTFFISQAGYQTR